MFDNYWVMCYIVANQVPVVVRNGGPINSLELRANSRFLFGCKEALQWLMSEL
jgi:hypothetical protein